MILSGADLSFFLLEGQKTKVYENVTPDRAKQIIDSKNPIVLDVRTPDEFENSHIPDAILVPVDELRDSTLLEVPDDMEILVYCRSGRRSSWAAEYLAQIGYAHVYNLSGGILAWENRGYAIVESSENRPTCPCVVL